jgi:hypothetical protein
MFVLTIVGQEDKRVEQTFCNLALTSLASFGDFMEYQRFH